MCTRALLASLAVAAATRQTLPLAGYDVVAYFSLDPASEGVLGSADFALNYTREDKPTGQTWTYELRFANASNRAMFAEAPEKYLPAYGGFCTWGMSKEWGPAWPWARDYLGAPGGARDGWFIVDGVLYLTFFRFMTPDLLANFSDVKSVADERWAGWFGGASYGPLNYGCDADTWWGDTCTWTPQYNEGIANAARPLSDACIAVIDTYCFDHQQGENGSTTIDGMKPCRECLETHGLAILEHAECKEYRETASLNETAVNIYCM